MKKGILILLLAFAFNAEAQSLKDLLYSGKLKKDSSGVIKSTDDLKSKIDTSQKKETVAENKKPAVPVADVNLKTAQPNSDSAVAVNAVTQETVPAVDPVPAANPAAAKTNNKIWKEYTDSLVGVLKTEALNSKKVKKETYFFTVDYEIDTDGQVSITNVTVSPENSFLQDQVKERILTTPPQLNAVIDSSNKARKVKRRHSFNITKD